MRFAYIDSQGKEVGIPTVEALQLRIELGAIVSSTMFFDASSDRWAPAREHEIFRTLQRELSEKQEIGFVAPPPVFETPAQPPQGQPGSGTLTPSAEPGPDSNEAFTAPVDLDAGLPPPDQPGAPPGDVLQVSGFTLRPVEESQPLAPGTDATPPHGDPLRGGFEPTSLAQGGQGRPDGVPAAQADAGFELGSLIDDASPLAAPAAGSLEPDLRLESRLSEQDLSGEPSSWTGVLDVEPAMPTPASEGPPGWADEDAPAGGAGEPLPREEPLASQRPAPSAGTVQGAAPGAREARAEAPRRAPRSRPQSSPRAASTPARSGPAMAGAAVLVVALVGGAGWFGWSFLRGRAAEPESAYEPVEIPVLPPELEATYRGLAGPALEDAVVSLSDRYETAGLPAEPPPEWLAGQYLATASRYPDVAAYWEALSEALAALRSEEDSLFRAAFEARMAGASLPDQDRAALVERATAGFRAALPERDRWYDQLSAVIVASLELHEFLTENEESIDYEPAAAGISRDPVLEAVPASRELGDEMWQRVDQITSALETMDALSDRVTTQRLFSQTLERIAATPVR